MSRESIHRSVAPPKDIEITFIGISGNFIARINVCSGVNRSNERFMIQWLWRFVTTLIAIRCSLNTDCPLVVARLGLVVALGFGRWFFVAPCGICRPLPHHVHESMLDQYRCVPGKLYYMDRGVLIVRDAAFTQTLQSHPLKPYMQTRHISAVSETNSWEKRQSGVQLLWSTHRRNLFCNHN